MTVSAQIKQIIETDFDPVHFEIINESHKHKGHVGDDGTGDTHFRLLVVSSRFDGIGRVDRNRLVNNAVKHLFSKGLHALSMKALSPEEYK